MKKFFLLFVATSITTFAQITITSSDIANVFALGNSATIHSAETTTFNIGSAGGGNNWDFSGLQSTETFTLLSMNPATTPHVGEFPGANLSTYSQGEYGGYPSEIWSYMNLNGNFTNLGQAITSTSLPGVLVTMKNDPPSIEIQTPMTHNSTWSQSYVSTQYYNGSPLNSTNISSTVLVDGYGTMTLPGGSNFDALRIRETMIVSGNTSVTYSFLAKNGANVSVSATDPNPPTSGTINADWYDWNTPFTSDVEQISGLPQDFNLSQNYPNPFNPSTKIEYSISEQTFVQLKVYDILGNEVAELVNEEQSAGTYRADFSGSDLASGLYIAKLQAGNYTKMVKMTLMK